MKQNEKTEILTQGVLTFDMLEKQQKEFNKFLINTSTLEKTGFDFLDKNTKGLKLGQTYVIAARPGVGKTTLGLNLVSNASEQLNPNEYILIVSLELTNLEIMEKIQTRLNYLWETRCEYPIECKQHQNILFFALDKQNRHDPFTIDKLDALIDSLEKEGKKIRLVLFDYLQKIEKTKTDITTGDKLEKASRKLKNIAQNYNLTVLLLSQLNRDFDKRKNKDKPDFSDLKGSGSIEEDADVVIFLYENRNEVITKDVINISIAKNRNGNTCDGSLIFVKEKAHFKNFGF